MFIGSISDFVSKFQPQFRFGRKHLDSTIRPEEHKFFDIINVFSENREISKVPSKRVSRSRSILKLHYAMEDIFICRAATNQDALFLAQLNMSSITENETRNPLSYRGKSIRRVIISCIVTRYRLNMVQQMHCSTTRHILLTKQSQPNHIQQMRSSTTRNIQQAISTQKYTMEIQPEHVNCMQQGILPCARTFARIHQRLRENGTFDRSTRDVGRPRAVQITRFEERVLHVVDENLSENARRIAVRERSVIDLKNLSCSSVASIQDSASPTASRGMPRQTGILEQDHQDPSFAEGVLLCDGEVNTDIGVTRIHTGWNLPSTSSYATHCEVQDEGENLAHFASMWREGAEFVQLLAELTPVDAEAYCNGRTAHAIKVETVHVSWPVLVSTHPATHRFFKFSKTMKYWPTFVTKEDKYVFA
ncbi:hypothetical protein C0J52_02356 [Blattella germanica]|nr:hypothetical protein C0J52_02356 [Blattella germanica]